MVIGLIPAHAAKTVCPASGRWSRGAHPRSRGENTALLPRGQSARGSSPLTRGKPAVRVGAHLSDLAHPRSRGENGQVGMFLNPARGSSPLTRGKQHRGDHGRPRRGLIPAHAGKTRNAAAAHQRGRAHPRSRGENASRAAPLIVALGSSPLTRGKRIEQAPRLRVAGLIPAHAGKTSRRRSAPVASRAHPRSRGENRPRRLPRPCRSGSSPLTRGKPRRRYRPSEHRGLIPAHAGKTLGAALRRLRGGAHPRSRGENWVNVEGSTAPAGSSPLTRGKRGFVGGHAGGRGLIPAHAGKTSCLIVPHYRVKAHPRSRGENRPPLAT